MMNLPGPPSGWSSWRTICPACGTGLEPVAPELGLLLWGLGWCPLCNVTRETEAAS